MRRILSQPSEEDTEGDSQTLIAQSSCSAQLRRSSVGSTRAPHRTGNRCHYHPGLQNYDPTTPSITMQTDLRVCRGMQHDWNDRFHTLFHVALTNEEITAVKKNTV